MTVCPGQFAFLATQNEEKHPFSIAQSLPNGEFLFAVKALGDFTSEKVPLMMVGEDISIEGPWGGFIPELFSGKTELWFAGGVGIAPFCTWLQALANSRERGKMASLTDCTRILLLWCIRDAECEPLLPRVQRLAKIAGIRLKVIESKKKRLDITTLFSDSVPNTLALCASARLSKAIINAYVSAGGSKENVRLEHFEWRN